MNEKKFVVVSYNFEGIIFAENADTIEEAHMLIFNDVLRLMAELETNVELSDDSDGYGEPILTARYQITKYVKYKICANDKVGA